MSPPRSPNKLLAAQFAAKKFLSHIRRPRVSECKADPYGDAENTASFASSFSPEPSMTSSLNSKLRNFAVWAEPDFPPSVKWDLVRQERAPVKYVVCNADESEPARSKDRFIMTHLPHLLIEGMLIAGIVTGAKRASIHPPRVSPQEEILGEEIGRCRRAGLLGKKILGSEFDFELEVFVSPAAISAARKPRCWRRLRASSRTAQQNLRFLCKRVSGRSPRCSITSRLSSTCRKFWRGVSIGSPRRA